MSTNKPKSLPFPSDYQGNHCSPEIILQVSEVPVRYPLQNLHSVFFIFKYVRKGDVIIVSMKKIELLMDAIVLI